MPEDAPVMSTTFPATSSLSRDLRIKKRELKDRNESRKKRSVMRPIE